MILISVDLPAPFSPSMAWMRPGVDGQVGLLQRPHAAIALGDAFHPKERNGAVHRRLQASRAGERRGHRRAAATCDASDYWFAFGLAHDFLRGEVDAAGREGIADEEVVGLVGVVVRARP